MSENENIPSFKCRVCNVTKPYYEIKFGPEFTFKWWLCISCHKQVLLRTKLENRDISHILSEIYKVDE